MNQIRKKEKTMRFPKFPKNMKQHMPFIGEVNGNPEFLVCLAKMDSKNWKIYRYNDIWGYTRLTNAPDNVIECNPSVEQNGDEIIYSWSYQTDSNEGRGVIHKITKNEFDALESKNFFDFDDYSNDEKMPYGIYHNKQFYNRIDLKQEMGAELVLHIQVYSDQELIITYIENDVKKSCLYDVNEKKITRELKDATGKYLYKPCYYKGNWFGVITLSGTNPENRYVVPVKMES